MATEQNQSHQRGVVFLVLLALIVVGIAVAAFFFVARAQSADNISSSLLKASFS